MTETVTSLATLNAAILQADAAAANSGTIVIDIAQTISLTAPLEAIDLAAGVTLDIVGQGNTLDGGGTQRGLFVYAGVVDVSDLTIADAAAAGGAGGTGLSGGGGGAGLGGGLFVASGGDVTLTNVSFSNDSATGGAGGAQTLQTGSFEYGWGGGGGLGGNGGKTTNGSGGGGGGIGAGASGGSGGASGGAGVVPGVAGGGAGSGGGAGGSNGGGGGSGGGFLSGGGGGGIDGGAGSNGNEFNATFGAGGGFGGGGGGGYGGNGGFGGGGAGDAGVGGFGGGGGGGSSLGTGGSGGFGGGHGGGTGSYGSFSGGGGGGGLGAGGDIFVQQGGSLTIEGGNEGAGTVTAGAAGASVSGNPGDAGSAYGSGLFIQGTQSVTLGAPAGQTLTLAGVIADQTGSGGSGLGSLVINGAGTVALSAVNTYAGGTTLDSGTLALLGPAAAGSGTITFAAGGTATLLLARGVDPANTIAGFLAGETIDLAGIGKATAATLSGGNTLTISGGGSTPVVLHLDPNANYGGTLFVVGADAGSGSIVMPDPGPALTATAAAMVGHGRTVTIGTAVAPDLAGDTLSLQIIGAPKYGTLKLQGGIITYTETATVTSAATDSFSYAIVDRYGKATDAAGSVRIDPGPTAGTAKVSVSLGGTIGLTAAILAAVKPGLPNDSETITALASTSPNGSETLTAGVASFTASGGSLGNLPANGTTTLSVGYTVTDQLGDTASGTVQITVTNPVHYIYGSPGGGSTIEGTAGTDIITAYGWGNVIHDNGGNDTVYAGEGQATVDVAGGNVLVQINGFDNTVTGTDGRDTVAGGLGSTSVALGNGNDTVTVSGYYDSITLGNGNDTVTGPLGNGSITLGNGIDVVSLAGYNNRVHAGATAGTDYIDAGVGSETVTGGNGNFVVLAGGYNDVITLGNGNDDVFTTPAGNPSLPAGDPVPADQGAAMVITGSGNDTIDLGGYGNVVDAGGGMNFIRGGIGDDSFVLSSPGFDEISGFSLTNGDLLNVGQPLVAAGWSGNTATLSHYLSVTSSGANSTVSIVPGGHGTAVAIAQLDGVRGLTLATLESHLVL
jgi:hypothetical protein